MLADALSSVLTAASRRASAYSDKALARVWKAERFTWSLTSLMHRFPSDAIRAGDAGRRARLHRREPSAAQTSIAENYVGMPFIAS